MELNSKFIAAGAAGAAGVVAIGGAGLYAGVLGVTTAGTVGSGSVALQASCASTATIAPGLASWDESSQKYMYTTATVDYTAGGVTCAGQKATVNVYNNTTGAPLITANTYTIDATDAGVTRFVVTFPDSGVDSGVDAAVNDYGLVIQSA